MSDTRRYLAIVQLKSDSDIGRIQNDVPQIINFLQLISHNEMEQVFRSRDGLLFGFFIKTDAPPYSFKPGFESCYGTLNGDSLLIFEAGETACGIGFSRAWNWLDHH